MAAGKGVVYERLSQAEFLRRYPDPTERQMAEEKAAVLLATPK